MEWFYAVGGDRKGPVSEDDFQRLVQQGVITSGTLVWREGMANWQPHGGGAAPPLIAGATPAGEAVCAGCGRIFPNSEVIPLANGLYCAACKPLALQRLKEGAAANDVEELRREYLKHEASVKSIGLLYYLGGAGLLLMGAGGVIAGMAASRVAAPLVIFLFVLLVGAGQIWVGAGLRGLKKWARIPTGILSGLGLIAFPLGTIINAYILYLIFSQKGKMVFSDEYRAVIEQTPHIKYRTSIVVWILVGLVLLLILIGLAAMIFGR